jgi:hypothetical protein
MEHHCHIKLISHIAIRHIWYSSMIEWTNPQYDGIVVVALEGKLVNCI